MKVTRPIVGVTGANGYLGSLLCEHLDKVGFEVIRLVRRPEPGTPDRPFVLGSEIEDGVLENLDVVVHCAYDFATRSKAELWETNVLGTRKLFAAANVAGVRRTIFLSSMSAYPGTRQVYGRAKLASEIDARSFGFCSVRPGLVYGKRWGGTAGSLRKLAMLPVVPLVGAKTSLFCAHEDDLAEAIVDLAKRDSAPVVPLGLAHEAPVNFRDLFQGLAQDVTGKPARFLHIPWRLLLIGMRLGEALRVKLPLRADSLLGLMRPARQLPNEETIRELGLHFREFSLPLESNL